MSEIITPAQNHESGLNKPEILVGKTRLSYKDKKRAKEKWDEFIKENSNVTDYEELRTNAGNYINDDAHGIEENLRNSFRRSFGARIGMVEKARFVEEINQADSPLHGLIEARINKKEKSDSYIQGELLREKRKLLKKDHEGDVINKLAIIATAMLGISSHDDEIQSDIKISDNNSDELNQAREQIIRLLKTPRIVQSGESDKTRDDVGIPEPTPSAGRVKSKFQRLIDGELDPSRPVPAQVSNKMEIEIVPDKPGEGLPTIEVIEEAEVIEKTWLQKKAEYLKERKEAIINAGLALIALGAVFLGLKFSTEGQKTDVDPGFIPVPEMEITNTPPPGIVEYARNMPTVNASATPWPVFNTPTAVFTEMPTFTPEPTREVVKQTEINFTRPVSFVWSYKLENFADSNAVYPTFLTDPKIIMNESDNIQIGNDFGADQDISAKPAWLINPDLTAFVHTFSSNRIVLEMHSGSPTAHTPSELPLDWQQRWIAENSGLEINAKQEINLPGQIFIDLANRLNFSDEELVFNKDQENESTYPIKVYNVDGLYTFKTIDENGKTIIWKITDIRKVPL